VKNKSTQRALKKNTLFSRPQLSPQNTLKAKMSYQFDEKRLQSMFQLLQSCGEKALNIRENELKVSVKDDKSWVSNADNALSRILIDELKKLFPDYLIFSEEEKPAAFDKKDLAQKCIFIDPIDGTSGYIKKTSAWSIQVGASFEHKALWGFVYCPENKTCFYAAQGSGAWKKIEDALPTPLRCADRSETSQEELCYTRSPNYTEEKIQKLLDSKKISKSSPRGSIGLKLMHILENQADFFLNRGGKTYYWDILAPEIIFTEGGGSFFTREEFSYIEKDFKLKSDYITFNSSISEALKKIEFIDESSLIAPF